VIGLRPFEETPPPVITIFRQGTVLWIVKEYLSIDFYEAIVQHPRLGDVETELISPPPPFFFLSDSPWFESLLAKDRNFWSRTDLPLLPFSFKHPPLVTFLKEQKCVVVRLLMLRKRRLLSVMHFPPRRNLPERAPT